MRRTYGDEETAKRVFYARENKQKAARKKAQLRAVRRRR
jgi:hypothetical protein